MSTIQKLLTEHLDIWTAADTGKKSGRGRSSSNTVRVYGIKKLRELILELAVRGKLVPQDPNDEPASVLFDRIQAEKAKLVSKGKIKKDKPLLPISRDEKPFELPKGWEWVRLGTVCSYIQRGKGPMYVDKSDFVVISQKCVRWTGLDLSQARYINPESISKYEEIRLLCEGDILWNSTGTGTIGRACCVPELGINKTLVADSHVTVIRSIILLSVFLSRWIESPSVQSEIEAVASGTTNQIELNTSTVISHLLPLPPLAEQHRIVTKVDELMALCDQLETQHNNAVEAQEKLVSHLLAILTQSQSAKEFSENWHRIAAHFDILFTTEASIDALKQTLLQLAVMGKLVPQDPNDEPASSLLKRILKERDRQIEQDSLRTTANDEIQDSEMYISIPRNWQYCRLGNLARFIDYRGKTPTKVDSGIPLITAKNVRLGYISREPKEYITAAEYKSWMTRGFPRVGDMLFTTEAPLGNIAIVDITERFALAQRVICLQLHDRTIAAYLKIAIMSDTIRQQLINAATGMTATGIKSSKLKEIPIPIPSIEEQHRIVTKSDELMLLCDQLKTRIAEANQLQKKLAKVIVEQAVT